MMDAEAAWVEHDESMDIQEGLIRYDPHLLGEMHHELTSWSVTKKSSGGRCSFKRMTHVKL